MLKSAVYYGDCLIGEAEIYLKDPRPGAWVQEIKISHLSPPGGRCPQLAVLHTIAPAGALFRMQSGDSQLLSMHAACRRENKTAVVPFGQEEVHLVAMSSRKNLTHHSCFWGFSVPTKLYNSCLVMLNRRCLGIVFDLDETLIVANTMRSFEDKIETLQRKISNEVDPQRVNGILAEINRYQDDKSILKQYIENNQIVEDGEVFEVQSEIVQPSSDSHQLITRPIIRIPEKNIVLTRVNPAIRDTSVLVRLRPAWENLRSYLTTIGAVARKRFEVYVCTMAERDYALEMWRLLDPEANLIHSSELLDRIVCVKSGSRKSLFSVFQDGICHPKMALVIDDRLKVWDEKDQPQVHVVPAFVPYYAPQAEANSSVPVLCVARNVACNVRGSFFKEFDEGLLPRISDVYYEDEMANFPSAPDDVTSATNGNKGPLCNEGMLDFEVERRLKDANCSTQAFPLVTNTVDIRPISSLQHPISSSSASLLAAPLVVMPLPNNQLLQPVATGRPLGQSGLIDHPMHASPAIEEGEVPESELDPDTRRRLLILQHGQDTRDSTPPPPPFSLNPPSLQVSVPPVQARAGWFPLEEEINPRQLKRPLKQFPLELEPVRFHRNGPHRPSLFCGGDTFIPSDKVLHEDQRFPVQVRDGDDRLLPNRTASNYPSFPGEKMPMTWTSSNHMDVPLESDRNTLQYADSPAAVLHGIASKLGTKVEFEASHCDTTELRFSIEAWFVGQKVGEGIGRTRKEAQHRAAETGLRFLANNYLSNPLHGTTGVREDMNKVSHVKENGFRSDSNVFGYPAYTKDELFPSTSTSEGSNFLGHKHDASRKVIASVATLQELCVMEGYDLSFRAQPLPSLSSIGKEETYAQVEIAGQIFGKGTGTTWEEAKVEAAEEALGTLKTMPGQFTQKRLCSPRSTPATSSKRLKQDISQGIGENTKGMSDLLKSLEEANGEIIGKRSSTFIGNKVSAELSTFSSSLWGNHFRDQNERDWANAVNQLRLGTSKYSIDTEPKFIVSSRSVHSA